MFTIRVFLLFLSLVFSFLCCSFSTVQHKHHRRVLHQPLFPRISNPPTQAPTSSSPQPQPKQQQQQQQPKLPFSSSSSSSSSSQKPFFPSYHTPPFPPSPTIVATFPANISSLLLPRQYSRHHPPVIAVAVSLSLLSLALLAAATAFAKHRLRNKHAASAAAADDDDKASRSDNLRLFPPNTATSDGGDRGKFLYLGTVASSEEARGAGDSSCSSNGGFRPPYRKLGDSPELNPLPPLPRYNFRAWASEGDDVEEKKEEEEEEEEQFFSPRGSSGNKLQSPPSPSGVVVAASSSRSLKVFHFEKFGSRSFTSRTPSYPRSNSLSNSMSCSPLSPRSIKSLPPQNPVSPSFSSSSSSPKPREDLSSTWNVSGQGKDSQTIKLPPPPPPPPPPPRFWETPVVGRLGEDDVGVKNENEETPKPKLKALHWDKVKASSDRVMVWDRLRPSSFQ